MELSAAQKAALGKLGAVLVYAHGSVAEGTARSDSDLDIAVLLERAPEDPAQATADIVQALAGLEASREMDVAILNAASPLLRQRVASRGALLFARSQGDIVSFQLRAMHEYESSKRIAAIGRAAAMARAGV